MSQHGSHGGGSISLVSTTSLTSTSGKQDRVKVAIQPNESQGNVPPLLMDFEHSNPLTSILKEVCARWDIQNPELYSFKQAEPKANAGPKGIKFGYLTELNRTELRNGEILCIALAPANQAKETYGKINTDSSRSEGIKELAKLSRDITFASEFVQLKGISMLMSLVEKIQPNSLPEKQDIANILGAFQDLMEHGYVSWDTVGENFVRKVINNLKSAYQSSYFAPFAYRNLGILESILLNSHVYYGVITEYVSPETIINQFISRPDKQVDNKQETAKQDPQELDVIHYALAFINARSLSCS